jgi:hypothetical protein
MIFLRQGLANSNTKHQRFATFPSREKPVPTRGEHRASKSNAAPTNSALPHTRASTIFVSASLTKRGEVFSS